MKKLFASLLFAVTFALVALSGCSGSDSFTAKSYSSDAAAIESVRIEVADRRVELGVSEDDRVHIDYFDGEKEYLEIAVSERRELTVTLVRNKEFSDYFGTKSAVRYRTVVLKLPESVADLAVSTTNEPIEAAALSVTGSVTLSNNGGGIRFGRFSVGSVISLTAKNGDVRGAVRGGWDEFAIDCTIKKGKSNLPERKTGGEKSLKVNCNHGDVAIDFETE